MVFFVFLGLQFELDVEFMSVILALEEAHKFGYKFLWLESDSPLEKVFVLANSDLLSNKTRTG